MSPWLLLFVSYLLGSIPSSYVAARLAKNIDLREHGSGNLGATNTFRLLGARIAAPVMVFDVLKGWAPTWFFPQWDGAPAWEWALAYGAAAILGHVYSIFMRFRGGKGVATAAGVFLALAPVAVGAGLVVWLAVLALFRMVSLASVAGALTVAAVLLATEMRQPVLWLGVAVAAFVVYAHRSNLRRIARGEEYRFGGKRGAAKTAPDREAR